MQSQHSSSAKPHSSASRHPQRGGVEGNGNPTRQAHHRAPFTQNGTGTPSYSHPSPSSAYRAGPPPDSTVLAEEALSDPWGYDVVPGGQGRHYHDQASSLFNSRSPFFFLEDWLMDPLYHCDSSPPSEEQPIRMTLMTLMPVLEVIPKRLWMNGIE